MICDQCCRHIKRALARLQGKIINCIAYDCDGGKCDFSLRKSFDEYYKMQVQKSREEK